MNDIVPAIIPNSFDFIEKEVSLVKDVVQKVQIDISDGVYTKQMTWPYRGDTGQWEKLLSEEIGLPFWEDIEYEFHLMVDNPDEVALNFIRAGASALVVHSEKVKDLKTLYALCQSMQVSLVLATLPTTPLEEIRAHSGMFDALQCMGSTRLGFHGEALDDRVYEQIQNLRKEFPEMPIAIDIGVTDETIPLLEEAGASVFVSGSGVFGSTQ
jgi:pentose-5-phosphate-3-epimerase